jgi:PEP-CTERM motif
LGPGTHWFGLSGAREIGWDLSYQLPRGNPFWVLQGNTLLYPYGERLTALPFRLYGTSSVLPEPGTWSMLIMGFGLVGAMARRRIAAA